MTAQKKTKTLGDIFDLTNTITIGKGSTSSSPYYSGYVGPVGGAYTIGAVGAGSGSWSYSDITSSGLNGTSAMSVSSQASLKLQGENADIDINGVSLKDFMKKVEGRLALLTPDTRLESEWEELKALGDQYRALEKHILEKNKTWDILKKE